MSDASQGPGWWKASDGKWYAPESHPDYPPPPPSATGSLASPSAASSSLDLSRLGTLSVTAWVMVGASALVILGSFMPWVSASVGFLSASANGISGDGKITLILGLIALASLLASVWISNRFILVLPVVIFTLSTVLCIYEVIHISSKAATSDGITVTASVGGGVYLCLVASVAGAVSWVVNRRQTPRQEVAQV